MILDLFFKKLKYLCFLRNICVARPPRPAAGTPASFRHLSDFYWVFHTFFLGQKFQKISQISSLDLKSVKFPIGVKF